MEYCPCCSGPLVAYRSVLERGRHSHSAPPERSESGQLTVNDISWLHQQLVFQPSHVYSSSSSRVLIVLMWLQRKGGPILPSSCLLPKLRFPRLATSKVGSKTGLIGGIPPTFPGSLHTRSSFPGVAVLRLLKNAIAREMAHPVPCHFENNVFQAQ